jgi:alpha-2-macroglobulin
MRNAGFLHRIASLVITSILLSACNQPEPRTAVTPNAAPQTPTPPLLVDYEPVRGEELPADRPLVLTFDQPMDRASVEQAVQIDPRVEGAFTWASDNVVSFAPRQGWARALRYAVTLKETAKSARGLLLARPESFGLSTVGYLEVAQTIPADQTDEVASDATITVLFNRPVVSLTALAQQAALPAPVQFEPPIDGQGEWLNTSIYVLRPNQSLRADVVYQGTVQAGLQDTTGALLQKDYTWSFHVATPFVKSFNLANLAKNVDLRQPISVTFSQEVMRDSAQAAFSIEPAVKGTFRWAGAAMGFVPEEDYQRATLYTVRLAAGIRAATGDAIISQPSQLSFRTIEMLGIASTTPGDGVTDYNNPYVQIRFTAPVLPETVMPNVTIEPPISLTKVFTSYWGGDPTFYLRFLLMASTQYTLQPA